MAPCARMTGKFVESSILKKKKKERKKIGSILVHLTENYMYSFKLGWIQVFNQ